MERSCLCTAAAQVWYFRGQKEVMWVTISTKESWGHNLFSTVDLNAVPLSHPKGCQSAEVAEVVVFCVYLFLARWHPVWPGSWGRSPVLCSSLFFSLCLLNFRFQFCLNLLYCPAAFLWLGWVNNLLNLPLYLISSMLSCWFQRPTMTNTEGQYTIKSMGLSFPYVFYDNNVFALFSKKKDGRRDGRKEGKGEGREEQQLSGICDCREERSLIVSLEKPQHTHMDPSMLTARVGPTLPLKLSLQQTLPFKDTDMLGVINVTNSWKNPHKVY